jgi:hypothetical protein
MRLAIVVELGAQHAAGAQRLAIGFQRFIDHGKAVALAQAAAEVQLALEDVGHLHGNTVGNVGHPWRQRRRSGITPPARRGWP